MSQADAVEDEDDEIEAPGAPPGVGRYISVAGMARLQSELNALLRDERPRVVEIVSWAAGNGDRSENGDYLYGKKRLREIDRRIRFLTRRIDRAIPVDPAAQARRGRVFFGAAVTYVGDDDAERTVRILGVDEAELARGEISLASPLARALLGRAVGDEVSIVTPQGRAVVEILSIAYPSA